MIGLGISEFSEITSEGDLDGLGTELPVVCGMEAGEYSGGVFPGAADISTGVGEIAEVVGGSEGGDVVLIVSGTECVEVTV